MNATAERRFWFYVQRGADDACWLWTASRRGGGGHGQFTPETGRNTGAHRFSWELHIGPVPEGLCVLHNCPGGDNPLCVNPAHLWLGTISDNVLDAVAKGRWTQGRAHAHRVIRGQECHRAKLCPCSVRAIRRLAESRETTGRDIARRFGVSESRVSEIVSRNSWAHVP